MTRSSDDHQNRALVIIKHPFYSSGLWGNMHVCSECTYQVKGNIAADSGWMLYGEGWVEHRMKWCSKWLITFWWVPKIVNNLIWVINTKDRQPLKFVIWLPGSKVTIISTDSSPSQTFKRLTYHGMTCFTKHDCKHNWYNVPVQTLTFAVQPQISQDFAILSRDPYALVCELKHILKYWASTKVTLTLS